MKRLALLALLACSAAQAAPTCWPSVANPPITGTVAGEPGVFYAAWQCPPDQVHFYTFTPAEALPWITSTINGAFDPAAATTAAGTSVPLTAVEQATFHALGVNQGWFTPAALTAVAYKQRQAVDGTTYVAIGSVAVGTLCTMQGQAGDYMPVPRAAVKLASRFDTLPLVAYAKCG